jgi:hypothetical protein
MGGVIGTSFLEALSQTDDLMEAGRRAMDIMEYRLLGAGFK